MTRRKILDVFIFLVLFDVMACSKASQITGRWEGSEVQVNMLTGQRRVVGSVFFTFTTDSIFSNANWGLQPNVKPIPTFFVVNPKSGLTDVRIRKSYAGGSADATIHIVDDTHIVFSYPAET